ncbi:MAG TPA: ATP-binding cassette domain-containing protein [bacterium]|nr:ATP-binding cassette domain-containing protein [bacterium]
MNAILTEKLTKNYGSLTALDQVDLEVPQGESFGLLGPNGAGKTTLISVLSTLLKPTSGRAELCGLDVAKEQARVRAKIGIVFQDPSLDERLTARENLELHCSLYGVPLRDRAARMDWALEFIELKARQHELVKTFSGGMRRRLEIARCLTHQPEVLFLDEPTVGLDPQTRDHIWTYLESLGSELGMTIVLTTHYMEEADRLCSRVAIIDLGRIIAVGDPEELKQGLGQSIVTMASDRPEELLEGLELTEDERARASLVNGRITLSVADPERMLGRAFKLEESRGLTVMSVSISRPTLNDVFLKFTGRELREEKADKVDGMMMRKRARTKR